MARKDWTPFAIDGVRYEVRRVGFMDTLKLSGLGVRVLGEPIFRALATSDSIRGLLRKLSASTAAEVAGLLEEDVSLARIAELAEEHLPKLLDMFGDGAAMLAENLTDASLEHLVRLAVLGKLKVDTGDGALVLVESTADLDNLVSPWVEEHGIAHQFQLLWKCLRHQAGPTKGGDRGSRPAKKPVAAAAT